MNFLRERILRSADNFDAKTYAETGFFRDCQTIKTLEREISTIVGRPNILMVGLGLESMSGYICFTPFKVVAQLEAANIFDFGLTLVDSDPRVIKDIQTREYLYWYDDYLSPNYKNNITEYNKFLQKINQVDSLVACNRFQATNTIEISEDEVSKWRKTIDYDVYHRISVPLSFNRRVKNGSIRLLEEDIAVARISANGQKYHFCEILNTLYLLTPQGQKLTLKNISSTLAKGGCILFDDGEKRNIDPDTPLLKRFGGWLDNMEIAQLGLRLEVLEENEEYFFGKSLVGILRKVS